jgi:hypothetical protein
MWPNRGTLAAAAAMAWPPDDPALGAVAPSDPAARADRPEAAGAAVAAVDRAPAFAAEDPALEEPQLARIRATDRPVTQT